MEMLGFDRAAGKPKFEGVYLGKPLNGLPLTGEKCDDSGRIHAKTLR
jgi:hypothetical protein